MSDNKLVFPKEGHSPSDIRTYAHQIRKLARKLKGTENEISDMICAEAFRVDFFNDNETLSQIFNYIKETDKMYKILCDFACELEKTAHRTETVLISAAPPPFDFITNFDIVSWWEQAYPVIEQIAAVTGAITGVSAFIKWVRSKLQEKQSKDEYAWIKLILNEREWNLSALSEKLDLTANEAKSILKGFGYKWDSKKQLYTATENTQKLQSIHEHKTAMK